MTGIAIGLGVVAGAGVAAAVTLFLRPARMNLVAAVALLDARTRGDPGAPQTDGEPAPWWNGALDALATKVQRSSNPWWGAPAQDLDLLDIPIRTYLRRRAASGGVCGLVMLGLPIVVGLPAAAPLLGVFGVVVGSVIPTARVTGAAATARRGARHALAAYLDLVAQERASGRAPAHALAEAAQVSDTALFCRIRGALAHSTRAGHTPWQGLRTLADRIGITELAGVADIAESAGDGATIYTTLRAHAASLRDALLAEDRTRANRRSEALVGPMSLLLIGFIALMTFPILIRF